VNPQKEATVAEKFFECEYSPEEGFSLHIRKPAFRAFSPEARGHVLEARKETLLALRSIVDAALERLEEKEGAGRRRRRRIQVE
jgi:hypothetical protein